MINISFGNRLLDLMHFGQPLNKKPTEANLSEVALDCIMFTVVEDLNMIKDKFFLWQNIFCAIFQETLLKLKIKNFVPIE
ncbi:hypothetical protein BpHYR1_015907 [Brachionus plicatilis]|uniref:Uncharacterized protein n=1 Tax=Brachionus plicatilis TaxID=10195 RepID=A0A3M7RT95_BRAPC|nr:hypothetical protein BpHYR1_015907 [Brachionus plicatilis]